MTFALIARVMAAASDATEVSHNMDSAIDCVARTQAREIIKI
jgi:hypothetical protein